MWRICVVLRNRVALQGINSARVWVGPHVRAGQPRRLTKNCGEIAFSGLVLALGQDCCGRRHGLCLKTLATTKLSVLIAPSLRDIYGSAYQLDRLKSWERVTTDRVHSTAKNARFVVGHTGGSMCDRRRRIHIRCAA
jgi:hypothetical protein